VRKATVVLATVMFIAATALAEDAFYSVPLTELSLTEGQLPRGDARAVRLDDHLLAGAAQPYAFLDGEGEVYVNCEPLRPWSRAADIYQGALVAIRAPGGKDVTGHICAPRLEQPGMVRLAFKVPATAASADAKQAFYLAKEKHYERLLARNMPGAPWWRWQMQESRAARTGVHGETPTAGAGAGRTGQLEDTYALLTGGRAMSENLQLDRVMLFWPAGGAGLVDVSTLKGITTRALDWAPIIAGMKPAKDPLASLIPADQHALFFPTYQAMLTLMDEAAANGTPVLHLLQPRSEDSRTRERYERQLCMKTDVMSRLLGPQVIASVAYTGSDPYMPTGTDLAILFEAKNLPALKGSIEGKLAAAAKAEPEAKTLAGKVGEVAYTGVRTPDRAVCSYMAVIGQAIVVTNSLEQLKRIAETASGARPSLASLPEYTFFRDRYKLGDKDETAFLIITDATIRRWCGPQWRIADSRRTRIASLMARLQAENTDKLIKGVKAPEKLVFDMPVPEAGELSLTPAGVVSSVYGTPEFLTPIIELPLEKVAQVEATAYERWRDGYQANFSRFFDPIAVRFTVKPDRIAADVTVMPLIEASLYREPMQVTGDAKIAPGAGDPHDGALLHFVMALSSDSEPVREVGRMSLRMAPQLGASPLAWLGQSVAIYVDDDPFWKELSEAKDYQKFLQEQYYRLPVALCAEVKNPLGLAAFLAALHGTVDQSAPGLTVWENLTYKEKPYVRIAPSGNVKSEQGAMEKLAIYYAATPKVLVVTLREDMLKRALDRMAKAEAGAAPPAVWLGESMCLRADGKCLPVAEALTADQYCRTMQLRSWGNLPALNEWRRLCPDKNPLDVHQKLFQTRLVCPGGGQYVWNQEWRTMESTVYGHPGQPKDGPRAPAQLANILSSSFGVTFERDGLRARAELRKKTAGQ